MMAQQPTDNLLDPASSMNHDAEHFDELIPVVLTYFLHCKLGTGLCGNARHQNHPALEKTNWFLMVF
jgi:hypothetical protein